MKKLGLLFATLSLCSAYSHAEYCNIAVTQYGALGNGTHDDTPAIQQAISQASNLKNAWICFPAATAYLVKSTITIPPGISLNMDAPLVFDIADDTPGLVIGSPGIANTGEFKLSVAKKSQSTWNNDDSVGIRIYNTSDSNIDIRRAERFTIGVQLIGDGKGVAHNHVKLGFIIANKIGLDLRNNNSSGSYGYVNENLFLGGHFGSYSNVNLGQSRYGIRITPDQASRANNNLFIKPSFELLQSYITQSAEALPILIERGILNRFESCRDEDNSATFARLLNNSTNNEFDVGRGNKPYLEDSSDLKNNIGEARSSRIQDKAMQIVFNSGPLYKKADYYNSSGAINIPDLHFTTYSNPTPQAYSSGVTLTSDHISIPSYLNGIGTFLSTQNQKRFTIKREVVDGKSGRIAVRAYGINDEVLVGGGATKYVSGIGEYASTIYSAYFQGTDNTTGDVTFSVSDQVKKVAVILTGGRYGPALLRSFSITSTDGGAATAWSGIEAGVAGANLVSEPATSDCTAGSIRYNAEPSVGEFAGWICTESQTWNGFGAISQ